MSQTRIIGIDPGTTIGLTVIEGEKIIGVHNLDKDSLWHELTRYLLHRDAIVIIEDIKPYSVPLRQDTIDTCKLIREVEIRLQMNSGCHYEMVSRFEVKKWVYDAFPFVCGALIDRKIDKKLYDACEVISRAEIRVQGDGKPPRKGSFVYVDDKIVTKAMKWYWRIKDPERGMGYEYGLKDHSWQSLALASYWKEKTRHHD